MSKSDLAPFDILAPTIMTVVTHAMSIRWIAHVDMDSFYVSVERKKNPSLIGVPLVVGGTGPRSVISSASYEARKFGVRSAMPTAQAKQLCKSLVIVVPDMASYAKISQEIFSQIQNLAPVMEQVSIDEAYLDFTGCERIYSSREETAKLIRERIKSTSGLTASVGIGTNKLIAKIASDFGKPDGEFIVPIGEEQKFLAPLSIRKIPGIGNKTATLLEYSGIKTCQDLVGANPSYLKDKFGAHFIYLQQLARGIDDSEVTNDGERKSLGTETTFDTNIGELSALKQYLKEMAEEIAFELRNEKLVAKTIQIKFRYPDFTTFTRAHSLEQPTHLSREIFETAFMLLEKNKDPNIALRLLGVSVKGFSSSENAPVEQLGLFEDPTKRIKEEKIEFLKDTLKKKFGKSILVNR